jgi:hypothetical protein
MMAIVFADFGIPLHSSGGGNIYSVARVLARWLALGKAELELECRRCGLRCLGGGRILCRGGRLFRASHRENYQQSN